MKRAALLALVLIPAVFAPAVHAREQAPAEKPAEAVSGGLLAWEWINFAILAGGLGYLIRKNAGPYFAARSHEIRKEMIEADDLLQQSEARAAEIERRLAGLESRIAALREESALETQSETERLSRYTAAEMAKIQAHTREEIASIGKAARMELRRYSAGLAIALAEQKIRSRMTPETQDALVRGFVHHLEPSAQARMS
jgi:F-type H+-transporting ATPase subunit b